MKRSITAVNDAAISAKNTKVAVSQYIGILFSASMTSVKFSVCRVR